MKEDIIAANLSSLRADIQALSQKIAEELNQNVLSNQIPHCKLMRLRWQALYPMLSVLPCSLAFMMMRNMWTRLLVPLRNLPICITPSQLTAIKMQRLLIAISN